MERGTVQVTDNWNKSSTPDTYPWQIFMHLHQLSHYLKKSNNSHLITAIIKRKNNLVFTRLFYIYKISLSRNF